MRITLDTNAVDHSDVVRVAHSRGFGVYVTSTTNRELLPSDVDALVTDTILEIAVFDESAFDLSVLGSDRDAEIFEFALQVIGNGSFPAAQHRGCLSAGQRRQLRDAQILASHAHHNHDIFVTADERGFISNGRRLKLENYIRTRILTPTQFLAEFQ